MDPVREHQLLLTRRQLFGRAAAGIGAAALGSLLNPESLLAAEEPAWTGRGSLANPHVAPRAKRVIYLFQSGGPSHIDLFDYQPALQQVHGRELPASIRGDQRITGMTSGQDSFPCVAPMFSWAQHGQSGILAQRGGGATWPRWSTSSA